MARRETKQLTFEGLAVPALPYVRTTDGHIIEWNRDRIVRQIVEETKLVETFYGYEGATEELAQEIALDVENRIKNMGLKSLSGPLIREIVNIILLERGMVQYRNVCTRSNPVYDAHQIDVGRGFEAHDNANLQENAETSHKKKADKISKKQYPLSSPGPCRPPSRRRDAHPRPGIFWHPPVLPGLGPAVFLLLRADAGRERNQGIGCGPGQTCGGGDPPCSQGPRLRPDQFCRGTGVLQFPDVPCTLRRRDGLQ